LEDETTSLAERNELFENVGLAGHPQKIIGSASAERLDWVGPAESGSGYGFFAGCNTRAD
jgi:hypothetical protein